MRGFLAGFTAEVVKLPDLLAVLWEPAEISGSFLGRENQRQALEYHSQCNANGSTRPCFADPGLLLVWRHACSVGIVDMAMIRI